ncbi:helix-turn-helix domain-containing protein [Paenibacillus sp. OAS669]|uniref:helix-turn-helix domain-containing protein n=1 Tax=Paenibacillus sp. OAS669 TaxID=2663821 RepID=UPI0017891439|nr:helix-turn-helix domain-containing protein [Paenibacillus sp. OAS669]MBE1443999.1 YesN/AraC family two-component response regulator [Paenibacillus sp. OAS669]
MRKYSFLTKMTLFGCILCTLPVIFIGFFSYMKSSKEIQKQVNSEQLQILTQMNSNVEQTLQTVNHALDQLNNSTVMSEALRRPLTEQDFMLYKDLRKEISNTQSFYTNLEDVVIVNLKQNWMLKNSGFYRMDQYIHRSQIANQMMLPNSTSWVLNPSLWFYSEEKANASTCPYTISLVQKLPTQDLDKYGLAIANISSCNMPGILNYKPRESETVMILDDQDRVIYHNDPSMIGRYAINTGFIKNPAIFDKTSDQFQTEVNGQKYTATYLRSSYNNWIYMSAISIDSLTKESVKIRNYTILISVIVVLVFMTVAWIFSRRMYSPIRRMIKQIPVKDSNINGPRLNEFDIIGRTMQDLSLSKSRLEQETHRHYQQARDLFLMKLFQGTMRRKDIMEKIEQLGFIEKLSDWKVMSVITIQIDTLDNTSYEKDDLDLLLFAVSNIAEETIPKEFSLPPATIDQTLVILVGQQERHSEQYNSWIYSLTESLQQMIQNVLKLKMSIGISLPFDDLKHTSIAYREGLEALKHRIHLGVGVIIHYANMNAGKHQMNLDYPWLTESEMFDAIRLADEEKVMEHFEHLFQVIFKHEMSPQEYQVPIMRLLNNLLIMIQEAGIRLNQLNPGGESFYEELNKLHIGKEIEEWFLSRLILPLIQIFRERLDSQYQSISETVLDRIHKQFDTDLTIEQCAADLHYNANYLSSVFRKETGQTFSEYLTAFRITMAKKWLIETDMPIKDIAQRLQYQPQNFNRFFRKQEGMTPGQYRESFRKNQS